MDPYIYLFCYVFKLVKHANVIKKLNTSYATNRVHFHILNF